MIKNILAAVGFVTIVHHAIKLIEKIIDYRVAEIVREERFSRPPKESAESVSS